jgi:flagellar hook-basal body complex protein FliE
MSSVSPISFPAIAQVPPFQPSAAQSINFQAALQGAVASVENSQATANQAVQNFISGQDQELHSTVLATQNAELHFDLLMQVRNKVVSAYEEIMRMQL